MKEREGKKKERERENKRYAVSNGENSVTEGDQQRNATRRDAAQRISNTLATLVIILFVYSYVYYSFDYARGSSLPELDGS